MLCWLKLLSKEKITTPTMTHKISVLFFSLKVDSVNTVEIKHFHYADLGWLGQVILRKASSYDVSTLVLIEQ